MIDDLEIIVKQGDKILRHVEIDVSRVHIVPKFSKIIAQIPDDTPPDMARAIHDQLQLLLEDTRHKVALIPEDVGVTVLVMEERK